jgi:tetratricopeptide (TPR) repeat protein
LYVLAIAYFKKKEFEKTAVIVSSLMDLEESDFYKNAGTYLLLGISWYYLENYKLSEKYLDKIIAENNKEYHKSISSAYVWKAILAQKNGDRTNAQKFLEILLNQYPKSFEITLVNRK